MAKKLLFGLFGLIMGFMIFTNQVNCADNLKILYRCAGANSPTTTLQPWFRVVNTGTTNLDLSRVKIRYWFTKDTSQTTIFACDWAQVGTANVTGKFISIGNPLTNVSDCFEVGFTTSAGSVAPGANSGDIQLRVYKDNWSNFTQTNDYSFDATKTSFAENVKVTGYIDDVLVYGTEPFSTQNHKKININQECQTLKTVVTAIDSGRYYNHNDIKDCFDGDTGTWLKSYDPSEEKEDLILNNTNPAYVRIEFSTAKNIKQVRAYLGDSQNQTWTVEAANTEADLASHTGTYQLVLPESGEITSAQWAECWLASAVTKKFWKFTIRATALGNLGDVHIPELELWSDDTNAPSAPSSLSATGTDATSIALTWTGSTDNVEVSGYKVYRLSGTEYQFVGLTTTTRYTDTFLSPNSSYTYKVSAVDAVGNESALSSTATASTTGSTTMKTINNVLVLYFNPIVKQGTYSYYDPISQTTETKTVSQDIEFSELYGTNVWADFLSKKTAEKIKSATGGTIDFRIYETREINDVPPANSPEWMNNNILIEFMELGLTSHRNKDYDIFHHGGINYQKLFRDNNILPLIENGTIDTVWVYASCPNGGFYETVMAGKNAFAVNSAPVDAACSKKFMVYIGGSVECMGHMVEDMMDSASVNFPPRNGYAALNTQDYNDPNRRTSLRYGNDWRYFNLNDSFNSWSDNDVSPGFSQLGNMHNPPNAYKNYSWFYQYKYFEGNTGDMWPIDGTWSCDTNAYKADKAANSIDGVKSVLAENNNPMIFRNFILETDVKLSSDGTTGSNAGVIFRVSNFGQGDNAFQGYYAAINAANDQVILAKINNNYSILSTASVTINPNVYYHLKVIANDSNFKVYVNDMNTALINYTDATPYNLPGVLGIRTSQTTAWFDNLFVNPTANSYADTWYNYPDLSGNSKLVSHDDWYGDGDTFQLWWFSHIPKNPGLMGGNFLNNWWGYVGDLNHFNYLPIFYQVNGSPVPPVIEPKVTVTSTSAMLTWTTPPSNSGVTSTEIYRDGVLRGTTTGSTFTDTNLTINTTYKYSLVTLNASSQRSIPIFVEATAMTGTAFFSGFEKVTNNVPDGWSIFSTSGNVSFPANSSQGYNNTIGAVIINSSASISDFYRTIRIKPKTNYQLSVWVKTTAVQGTAHLFLGFADGTWTNYGNVSGDSAWTQLTYNFNSGYNTSLEIHLRSEGTGTACFDEVKLIEQ